MKNTELSRILNKIEDWRDEIVADLQTLVQFESCSEEGVKGGSEPYGKQVALALNYMLERGVRFGMHAHNYDNHIGHVELGGSGRVRGSKGADGELIAVLTHLDVVPEGSGWTHPPFGGTLIADDEGLMRMYGRGTEDDKGPAVAVLYALRAILETETPLNNKRIRLLYGCDEEVGMRDVEHYLEVGEIPSIGFTPDGHYPSVFAEKGIITTVVEGEGVVNPMDGAGEMLPAIQIVSVEGGDADNKVPQDCQAVVLVDGQGALSAVESVLGEIVLPLGASLTWEHTPCNDDAENSNAENRYTHQLTLNAQGKSSHAMTPDKGINAIAIIMNTLTRIFSTLGESNTFLTYFQKYYVGGMLNIADCDTRGRCVGINHSDEPSGALTWNTAIIKYHAKETPSSGGVDFDFSVIYNIRYSVTLKWEDLGRVVEQKMKLFDAKGFTFTMKDENHLEPLYVERGTRLLNAISDAYQKITGINDAEPKSSGGGTYARWFDNFVSTGFAIRNQESAVHQADEFIYIEDLIDSTKIYATIMYNLLNSEEGADAGEKEGD